MPIFALEETTSVKDEGLTVELWLAKKCLSLH